MKLLQRSLVALVLVTISLVGPMKGYTASSGSTAVLDWNLTTITAIAADKQDPTASIHTVSLVQVAIYDAIQAIVTAPQGGYTLDGSTLYGTPADASRISATAAAARTVLLGLVPAQRASIDGAYATSLAALPDAATRVEGVLVGDWVGQRILAIAKHDGFTPSSDYNVAPKAGIFQPVPPAQAVYTQLGRATPLLLRSGSQFRPGSPPALTSAQYTADYNEMKSLGAANSTTRTADQTQIALFWLDDDAYIWNLVARGLAEQRHYTLEQDALLFAEMNAAGHDAVITVFDAKYTYNYWRPQAAIRAGDADGNPDTTADPSWTSLRPAPAHPDYPSAHATDGSAYAAVLGAFFGDATSFSFVSRTSPGGAARSFTSFSQAAAEEGVSRIYVGFHFRTGVNVGLALGRTVANWTMDHFGPVVPASSRS